MKLFNNDTNRVKANKKDKRQLTIFVIVGCLFIAYNKEQFY